MPSLENLGYKKNIDFSESRPWGRYDILLDTDYTKVKIITVAPNQRLSYQSHEHRQEQWVLVKGNLTVVRDDVEYNLDTMGETITIPLGVKHRAWNKSDEIAQFIEVQTGTYFGEDDIKRYEDDYMRSDEFLDFAEREDSSKVWTNEEDNKIHTVGGLTNDKEGSFMKFQKKINKNG
jgi:mannose-6-phosphate isomerase-like protein (cupin superfamily)